MALAQPAGPLRLLGGLALNTGILGFGGLSGLHMAPGPVLTAISDRGRFVEMRLDLDAGLRPMGLTLRRSGRLRDAAGRPLPPGPAGDAEALARQADGTWLLAFERRHRIQAHARLEGPGRTIAAPPGLDRAPRNAGLESLAVLADGRWLALAEGLEAGPGLVRGWLGRPGRWRRLAYRPQPGMVPVDAAALPEGGALVLERGFSLLGGFTGRLARLPAAALADPAVDAVLEPVALLDLAPPLPVDNYEGLAVLDHQGRRLVAIVSDDNERLLQRSLLLLFEMPPGMLPRSDRR
ncbi:esterase-like activity of phytase family protein [Falsiroseomonas selenitidurans]|uniref:Esterase-like activity of phytase family protein n=1 Tax=Falsiroseomonas selenitidurans TaxID=2716335 RepID=A0ABX1EA96_9PROT|nr:esterase-like activity of phytase family protein [Falsiroseomonas selenitidurans]NKC31855.1 esterase-like activity of phytase family protein [Falsiroseomonas selenitidurans]OYW09043.1 MAG: hypothetical protein B7Z53_03715 [Rhodospirillales bacterium 12-71-4]